MDTSIERGGTAARDCPPLAAGGIAEPAVGPGRVSAASHSLEVSVMLRRIVDQLVSTESLDADTLAGLKSRLAALAERAEHARNGAPEELRSAFREIDARIDELTRRLGDADARAASRSPRGSDLDDIRLPDAHAPPATAVAPVASPEPHVTSHPSAPDRTSAAMTKDAPAAVAGTTAEDRLKKLYSSVVDAYAKVQPASGRPARKAPASRPVLRSTRHAAAPKEATPAPIEHAPIEPATAETRPETRPETRQVEPPAIAMADASPLAPAITLLAAEPPVPSETPLLAEPAALAPMPAETVLAEPPLWTLAEADALTELLDPVAAPLAHDPADHAAISLAASDLSPDAGDVAAASAMALGAIEDFDDIVEPLPLAPALPVATDPEVEVVAADTKPSPSSEIELEADAETEPTGLGSMLTSEPAAEGAPDAGIADGMADEDGLHASIEGATAGPLGLLAAAADVAPLAVVADATLATTPAEPFDRTWFDGRLDELERQIASVVEQLRPDQAFDALVRRLDGLDQKVEDAIARHGDEEAIRMLETHIESLRSELTQVTAEIVRLERIEDAVAALPAAAAGASALDADTMREIAEAAARSASEEIADRLPAFADEAVRRAGDELAARFAAAQPDGDSETDSTGEDRLASIESMLSAFTAAHADGNSETRSLLESVQVLVESLTGRIDALEEALIAADEAYSRAATPEAAPPAPARAATPAAATPTSNLSAAALAVGPVPLMSENIVLSRPEHRLPEPDAEPEEFEPSVSAGQSARHGVARPEAGLHASAAAHQPVPEADTLSRMRSGLNREDLVASARRAAQSASTGSLSAAETTRLLRERAQVTVAAPAPAPKKKSLFSFDRSGPKPVLVIALIALATAGAGMVYGKLVSRSQGGGIRIEETSAAAEVIDDGTFGRDQAMTEPTGDVETWYPADDQSATPGISLGEPATATPEAAASVAAVAGADGGALSRVALSTDEAAPATPTAPALELPPAALAPLSVRVAAANGDPAAQLEIASRYLQGSGGIKDPAKAALWLQRAAGSGYALAQYHLGALYERGRGVEKDAGRAHVWYGRAADQGNVKAMHNLAVLYTSGVTGKADYAAAAGLFQKAASHGLGDSQFNLAVLYENGLGVERDDLEAYKWFSLAAASGDKEALARRDEVKKRLSKASVAKAEQAVKSWRPVPADRLANEGAQVGVLGVSLAPGASTSGAAAAGDDVAAVKDMLARLGYDVDTGTSGLDGKTRAAIMRFEGRSGMTPSGEVTPELVERLHALAG